MGKTRRAKCPRRKKSVRYTCIFLSLTTTETTTFTTTECILCSLLYSRVCFEPQKKRICFEPRGILSKNVSNALLFVAAFVGVTTRWKRSKERKVVSKDVEQAEGQYGALE